MLSNLYWDILDENRKKILPFFNTFIPDFYLAGGTALALQLGHRDMIKGVFVKFHALTLGRAVGVCRKKINQSFSPSSNRDLFSAMYSMVELNIFPK